MFAHDHMRTGWATEETILSPQNVGDLELKWKVRVKNEAKFLTALTVPVVATDVQTTQGAKTLVYVAGSSNNIHALDASNGSIVWSRAFDTRLAAIRGPFQGTWVCPNGITATPAIERSANTVYVIGADGRLFGLDLATGADKFPPIPFAAPFSKNWSLSIVDGLLYTSLSQNCGDGPSGFYSIDVSNPRRPVERRLLLSSTDSAGIWGRGGPVAGLNHRIYGFTADGRFDPAKGEFSTSVVAASLPSLDLADYFAPRDWQQITHKDLDMGSASPVWFTHQGLKLLAGGGKQGVVYLMDGDALGGVDHQTPLFVTPLLGNDEQSFNQRGIWGATSYWKDEQGEAWLYVPMWGPVSKSAPHFPHTNGPNPHGSIMAFQVSIDSDSRKPSLNPVWLSRDFNLPDPVVIANGVVFALSTGENADQTKDRSQNTSPAVLYALDAKTGRTLYGSGTAMETWVHFSGLALADSHVYVVDHDSRVYCFGLRGR
ncbi:MAG: PQQ-binding-like beta-propeller repeat protein [Bryobacteraceae bacterium]